ncbi:hypothetical protein O1611_g4135 [Lasiodiplodia mahajangana]|uniref:Uncharacterized protein n=1 Tax=Lasiodiplodia mahajangana TaxID=1108764 RepID=A0ACC2JPS1_9PEZI|nr:hypothetical protein O1611_g4135 [Lasiodiplodia mahajangana]
MATLFKSSSKDPSSTMPPSTTDTTPARPRTQSQSQSQSQPRSQPQPQSQSQSQSQPQPPPQPEPQKPQVDGKAYYKYLFNEDKSPTDTLNALLCAIGQYIIDHIGDVNDKQLNARKLAAFYHAVGGDYDALFKSPDRTISYIWQALGVQHTLQPIPDNDFVPPSIPALTLRGFVRWQSLQILLGPEEHVPYLQYAVAHWNLKHPFTGDPFPTDLPATAFPAVCDAAVDEWHKACGEKLREAATPIDDEGGLPRRHDSDSRIHASSNKNHGASTGATFYPRPASDYFRRRRPLSYVHVTEPRYSQHTSHPITPEANHRVSSSSGSSLDDFPRGRRHSDVKPPPVIIREETRPSAHLDPHRPTTTRRHSHTYHQSHYAASIPDSDSGSDTLRPSPRHNGPIPQTPVVRRMPVASPIAAGTASRIRRSEIRAEDPRRLSFQAAVSRKLASLLPSSSNRHRSSSRELSPAMRSSVRYRKEPPNTRISRSLSGGSYTSDGSLPEIAPKYSSRDSRESNPARVRPVDLELERDHERERERRRWEEEIGRKSRKDKAYFRPDINRRTSSHADVDRRRHDAVWDSRDRPRDSRDFEREFRRSLQADELDRRERRRYQDRGPSPPMTGVSGRRYPR